MKLTAFTDYSLRLMMYVAVHDERLVSIKEVSEVFDISRNHLMKIVHELGKGGYLQTVRGKNGGFRLGRPAAEINVGQLVRYTEEDMSIVECFSQETSNCKIAASCKLSIALSQALKAFLTVLDGYTLADLSSGVVFPEFLGAARDRKIPEAISSDRV
ncbi:Rrf2 family transcriptional regulator [Paremcibacter congregatus]|uniref:Rrf2 family transcriptional regulator n=1 Tax=Paremcibacter congregatus TaxID=2043170 RepID=UPI0030EB72BD|tara:strand:- start:560 stop:1033 length:474 start_codon:yes stop_codon:yes gene_type:complete